MMARDRGVFVDTAARYYVLIVLMLVGATNYLDRQVLTILLEPIRREMSLNDTQIGFITGIDADSRSTPRRGISFSQNRSICGRSPSMKMKRLLTQAS